MSTTYNLQLDAFDCLAEKLWAYRPNLSGPTSKLWMHAFIVGRFDRDLKSVVENLERHKNHVYAHVFEAKFHEFYRTVHTFYDQLINGRLDDDAVRDDAQIVEDDAKQLAKYTLKVKEMLEKKVSYNCPPE